MGWILTNRDSPLPPLSQKQRPPGERANDRSVTLPAGGVGVRLCRRFSKSAPAGIAPSLARWWFGGRSASAWPSSALRSSAHRAGRRRRCTSPCWSRPSAAPAVTAPVVAFVVPPHTGRGRRPFHSIALVPRSTSRLRPPTRGGVLGEGFGNVFRVGGGWRRGSDARPTHNPQPSPALGAGGSAIANALPPLHRLTHGNGEGG